MTAGQAVSLLEQVNRVARRQHGVISVAQLDALGASRGWIRGLRARGALQPVQAKVFRVEGCPDSWHGRALAACLQCGPGAVLSHTTAARLRGLDVRASERRLEITVPREVRRRVEGARVHYASSLSSADRALYEGLPVTTVGRTLVDIADRVSAAELARAVDDALVRQLVPLSVLDATAARLARRGSPGPALLRGALRPWMLGTLESHAEAEVLRRILDWGIPAPVPQCEICVEGERVVRVDFAWPDRRLALEVDGFVAHDGPAKFVADRARWNRIRAAGWDVVQVTLSEVRDEPAAVRRVLFDRLGAARPNL